MPPHPPPATSEFQGEPPDFGEDFRIHRFSIGVAIGRRGPGFSAPCRTLPLSSPSLCPGQGASPHSYAAQPAHKASACSRTVLVASSCRSGG